MNTIDERIVAMRFDNDQFEKGVRQSMKTLEDLREASNLDDVASNMGSVAKSVNKNLDFEDTTKSAGIFSKALNGLGSVAKKTFNAATFPLQALGKGFQTLGKYTSTVLGFDLASKLVNAGETVVRAFTIDPVKSGLSEYELKMDSIKTIMTGTKSTYEAMMKQKNPNFMYDEQMHLDYVKQGLEELNKYADNTVYSFQDMTSNIGKFTNAGVEFETAVKAIKGISNATAHAGQNAQAASIAMYNLSQAIGTGYLGTLDWKSIETARINTSELQKTLIDMGIALKKLKKDEKTGKIFTLNDLGQIDEKSVEVKSNIRDSLSAKWVTNDVLLAALGVYSGEYDAVMLRQLYNLTDEESKRLEELGKEASEAATQVRTFTKMWDALKEAAQSGWAMTWELIIGDLDEATAFWTSLNDRFSALINAQADSRNALFQGWRGRKKNEQTGEWEYVEGAIDGRQVLIEAINDLLDTVQSVAGAIGKAWNNVFGVFTSDKLVDATVNFRKFVKGIKEGLGKIEDPRSRLSKIVKGFEGIFGVFKNFGTYIKNVSQIIIKSLHLDKVFDTGLNLFSKIGEWLSSANKIISEGLSKLEKSEIVKRISEFFDGLWTAIDFLLTGKAPIGLSVENLEFIKVVIQIRDWFVRTWESIKGTISEKLSGIGEFFGGLWKTVSNFFTPTETTDAQGNTVWEDSQFVKTITAIRDWFVETYEKLKSEIQPHLDTVAEYGKYIWETVADFFTPTETTDAQGNTVWEDSPFVTAINGVKEWFESTWGSIKAAIDEKIPGIRDFFTRLWTTVSDFFKPTETTDENGNATWEDSPFVKAIKTVETWFIETWNSIKATIDEKIPGIRDFFTRLWTTVSDFFKPTETTDENGNATWEDSPFVKTINTVVEWFQTTWSSIQKEINPIINRITAFFQGIWDRVFGALDKTNSVNKGPLLPKDALLVASGKSMTDFSYSKVAQETSGINSILDFFSRLAESVGNFVENVKTWDGWKDVGEFFNEVFDAIGKAAQSISDITGLSTIMALGKSISIVLEGLGKLAGIIINDLIKVSEGDWGTISKLIGEILGVILGIAGLAKASAALGSSGDSLMKVSLGFLLLSGSVALLGALDINTLVQGIVAAGLLTSAIALIVPKVVDLMTSLRGREAFTGKEKILDNFVKGVVKIGAIAATLALLPNIIKTFKETPGTVEGFLEFAGGITVLLLGISVVAKILGTMELAAVLKGTVGLIAIVGALGLFMTAVGALVERFPKIGDYLGTFASGIGKFIGTLSGNIAGSHEGEKLVGVTEGYVKASEVANNIDAEGFQKLQDAMKAFKVIAENLPKNPTLFQQWFKGEMGLSEFADKIEDVGRGIVAFNDAMQTISDWEKIESGIHAVTSLLQVAVVLQKLNEVASGNTAENIYDFLYQLSYRLSGYDLYTDTFLDNLSGFKTFAEELNFGIEQGASLITVDPIVNAIKTKLKENQGVIAAEMSNLFGEWGSYTSPTNGETLSFEMPEGASEFMTLLSQFTQGGTGTGFLDGYQQYIPDFNSPEYNSFYTNMQDAMKTAIEEGMASANALNQPNTVTGTTTVINGSDTDNTPWLDMAKLNLQSTTFTVKGTISLSTDNLTKIESAINSSGRNIVIAVNRVENQIADTRREIYQIRYTLQNGSLISAFAGAVDTALGNAAVLFSRTGT